MLALSNKGVDKVPKYKVYLNEHIDEDALNTLQKYATVTNNLDELKDIDAMIIRAEKVSRSMIEESKKLKVIGKHGIGYDSIDIGAAKEHDVKVVYTPEANVQSVSELIIALMTNVVRNISLSFEKGKKGENKSIAPKELMGYQLNNKTLGLIGAGKIGLNTSKIAKHGFDMKIVVYDPFVTEQQCSQVGIEKVDRLEDLMMIADFVSVSVPLTKDTKHLINERALRFMKPHAVLINTSRGGVIDEKALYTFLAEKKLFAAASDVFEHEPPTSKNPLLSLDNFVATPHIGANTAEAMKLMGSTVVKEVITVLEGKTPNYRVV
nr:hydroxyacid dehydrogenase [Oceanobacillus polygoni]